MDIIYLTVSTTYFKDNKKYFDCTYDNVKGINRMILYNKDGVNKILFYGYGGYWDGNVFSDFLTDEHEFNVTNVSQTPLLGHYEVTNNKGQMFTLLCRPMD